MHFSAVLHLAHSYNSFKAVTFFVHVKAGISHLAASKWMWQLNCYCFYIEMDYHLSWTLSPFCFRSPWHLKFSSVCAGKKLTDNLVYEFLKTLDFSFCSAIITELSYVVHRNSMSICKQRSRKPENLVMIRPHKIMVFHSIILALSPSNRASTDSNHFQ